MKFVDNNKYKILITGGAGFIGSNLIDNFLQKGHQVVCLDNLATGFKHNIQHHFNNPDFTFIKGDIRDLETCRKAVENCDYILHEAALGSVPRSINDPVTTNSVNIDGFVNMLVAARDAGVKRFIYAASSSTYGDSKKLPKIEEEIGRPLSPYAVTKYVNELYADVFAKTYNMECIGLRYFNVFGRRQDPNGAYAAVIPLWVKSLLQHKAPIINGDGTFSRDFTFIDNVILANEKALFTTKDEIEERSRFYNLELPHNDYLSMVFNVAFGGNTNLNELFDALKTNLGKHDAEILKINAEYGPNRAGDIPHSLASIEKARRILNYNPQIDARQGFELAAEWYFENLR